MASLEYYTNFLSDCESYLKKRKNNGRGVDSFHAYVEERDWQNTGLLEGLAPKHQAMLSLIFDEITAIISYNIPFTSAGERFVLIEDVQEQNISEHVMQSLILPIARRVFSCLGYRPYKIYHLFKWFQRNITEEVVELFEVSEFEGIDGGHYDAQAEICCVMSEWYADYINGAELKEGIEDIKNIVRGLNKKMLLEKTVACFVGSAIGDALGVPVEFTSRESLEKEPVTGYRGYGTHSQPPGTWSDDTSMFLCTAQNIIEGGDVHSLGKKFQNWRRHGYMTAHGDAFDIGITTDQALHRLVLGTPATHSGSDSEGSNGNGSLMRILPLAFRYWKSTDMEIFQACRENSSITHSHIRSIIGCYLLVKFATKLIKYCSRNKEIAFQEFQKEARAFLSSAAFNKSEVAHYDRILHSDFKTCPKALIHSSGYVVHSLEAAIWCVLYHNKFDLTVLEAVNLGEDTDTVGAIAGGLAGILYYRPRYGYRSEWSETLAKYKDIEQIAINFHNLP